MRGVSIRALGALGVIGIASAQGLAACSASSGTTGTTHPSGIGGDGNPAGGDTGLFGNGGDPGVGNATGSGSGTGVGGEGSGCVSDIHQGERLPLDMYFVVDTSGSMNEKLSGGTKWTAVSNALVGFLNDPANADIGTGIGYFPFVDPAAPLTCTTDPDCGSFGPCVQGIIIPFVNICIGCYCQLADACNVSTYAVPSVPIVLPPDHATVVADIAKHGPGGGTPTRPALEGGMQYANSWAAANPGRTTIVVLATDGDPTGCATNQVADSASIAAQALAGPNKIKTFVIGVGSSLTSLNQIASAGGTNQAFVLDTTGDVAKSFSAALAAIHGQAASCDFQVPTETASGKVNLDSVNVTLTSNGATTPVLQTADDTVATCGSEDATHPLWYFNADKTLITACPQTCGALTTGGSIQVVLGCAPTQKAPR